MIQVLDPVTISSTDHSTGSGPSRLDFALLNHDDDLFWTATRVSLSLRVVRHSHEVHLDQLAGAVDALQTEWRQAAQL